MNLRLTPAERSLGLQWVAAMIVGWIIGFYLCEAFKAFVSTYFVDGLIIGSAVGIAQWLVLRGRFAPIGWWVVLSIVGFGVGKGVADASTAGLSGVAGYGLAGAMIGLSVGIFQWLVLQRRVSGAAWWVPANVVAWAVGWIPVSAAEAGEDWPILQVYGVGAIGAALAGIITGYALVSLSRSRPA
jgi:hypothetical protein